MKKRFLLGFHDESYRNAYETLLRMDGAQVVGVRTQQEMMEQARLFVYDVYVMDLNLEFPNGRTISSARCIYNLVKPHLEQGAVFLGLSGNRDTIALAHAENIPAEEKGFDITSLL